MRRETESYKLEEIDRRMIRILSGDIDTGPTPFADLANEALASEAEIIARTAMYLDKGIARRLGAILNHRKAGYRSNVMAVWIVPEQMVMEVGGTMAKSKNVSHCYQRKTTTNWPYNLYTMVHGHTRDECLAVARELAAKTGIERYELLFSVREFKKTSMRYFYGE